MDLSRRDLFKWAAAAGAAGLSASAGGTLFAQPGRPPLKAGEGEVRISDVRTYTVGGRLLVRVCTDVGIDGWGEINTVPPRMSDAIVGTFRPLLLGVNPTRIEHIWQMLYRAHRNVRGGHGHVSAIGGIDIALWDILGKLAKMPVYTLLGGPCRGSILCYPSSKARKATSHALHGMVETPGGLDAIVRTLEQARQKLGRDGRLMYDGHGKFTATVAIQLCKRIENLGLLYFEEVVPPESNADLVKVRRATSVPLAMGERMSTIWPFRRPLEEGAVDVLNPDVVGVGGISQLRKLAAIAELYDVPLAPHSTHSAIGLAATLHVDAGISNFLIQEAYQHIANGAGFVSKLAWSPDGLSLLLPSGPGLGVTVDPDGVKAAAAKTKAEADKGVRKAYFLRDGSVADR
jgi:galactonate dehydratase